MLLRCWPCLHEWLIGKLRCAALLTAESSAEGGIVPAVPAVSAAAAVEVDIAAGRAHQAAPSLQSMLGASATYYARMQGLGKLAAPYAAVTTHAEKDKVAREWSKHMLTQVSTC